MIIDVSEHPTPEELEAIKARKALYQSDPVLRELADKIHGNRMMPPPACDQCIQIALDRLKK